MDRARAYLSVGSNLEPHNHFRALLELLARESALRITGISTVYRTPALPRAHGRKAQDPDFLNGVVAVETLLGPAELLGLLGRLESALGRVRGEDRFAPRTMDVDLLLYLPPEGEPLALHPDVLTRPWVALPLLELAPDLLLPPHGVALREVATGFPGPGGIPEAGLTAALRNLYLPA